ncbi:serine beta-lactamase-like protein LACTB, mitochondrial [Pocillopora verrucosa]|uniref:serine beta-lactamase-like protein LACTB, mitochondrial n=1 Tax=Pocillopora verrucosa TaxID=203993 RepID=UPI00333F05F5
MAAPFIKRFFQSLPSSRFLGTVRDLNFSTKHQLNPAETGRRSPKTAFFLGFGLAGLLGFSGILYGKKQRKPSRIEASFVEKKSEEKENNSPLQISTKSEENIYDHSSWTIQSAIEESRYIIKCMKEEIGCPGVCIAVSLDGKTVWSEGFGFADVENRVLCTSKTVMRIASISKPITATAVAKLWEEGKLDLDAPIQKYVASFPEKSFRGSPVTLTTRHLLSHLGGIRHYQKPTTSSEENKTEKEKKVTVSGGCTCRQQGDSQFEEFYSKDHYKSVSEAIAMFKDDPLLSSPGASYLYTTHGWTLLSAVVESISGQDFLLYMKKLFKDLGMENTRAEFNDTIILNRARFYQRNCKGRLMNTPYVDNSYKWAGGGFLSTVKDLIQFGNSLLYAKQIGEVDRKEASGYLPGFLKPHTVTELWKIVANTEGQGDRDGGYGLGWEVIAEKQEFGCCSHQSECVFHDGGAVGASSILMIRPQQAHTKPPKGVVIAILVNLQGVNLQKTAVAVAQCFERTQQ